VAWGDVWGGAAWGDSSGSALPFEINIVINVSDPIITSSTGGLSSVISKSSITSVAASLGTVENSAYVTSEASGLSSIAVSDPLIKSLSSSVSKVSIKKPSLKSLAGGSGSTKLSLPTIKSTTAGLSKLAMVRISINSTAYEFTPSDTGGIRVSNPTITSTASGNSLIITNKPTIKSYAAGASIVVVPAAYIVSGVEQARIAYAMNVKTAEITKFTNYDFITIIRIGLDKYGVKPTGLYKIGGITDNGTAISASFTTHETRYDTNLLKRVPQVYIDSESITTVQPIIDGKYHYIHDAGFGGHKTKLGRGYIGKWWQWKISNKNGASMRVGAIEAVIENMSRRI